ncbi:MAG: alpha/beta hydrolase [Chloroflexi bacterium]|nr:alpha/beta hydrolase [Chloroflexota bacterium]
MNRRNIVILCTLIVLMLGACTTTPAPSSSAIRSIELKACILSTSGSIIKKDAKCGTLAVPKSPDNPEGEKLDLNIAVIPAVSRNPKPDPLFFLAGGPGQAATEIGALMSSVFDQANRDRDLVFVDQRGTGKSNPLKCDLPKDASQLEDDKVLALFKECPTKLQGDLTLFTTEIAMQDLDRVRQALHYEKINLYGASYGTRAALTYLRIFPDRVRTVILDGVVSADFKLFLTSARDGQRALQLLFTRCKADVACSQQFPNLQTEFETLLEKLDAAPVQTRLPDPATGKPIDLKITRDMFTGMVFGLLYVPELNSLLPLAIHSAAVDNNFAPLVAQASQVDAGLYRGMFYAVACTEDAPFLNPDEIVAFSRDSYFGDQSKSFREVCASWTRGQVSPDFRKPVASNVPVLLLSGEADPITPPYYADQVAATLPNSLHLIGPGIGHGLVMRGCVSRIATDFVKSASVKNLETACVQNIQPPPFFISPTGPKP